MWFNFSEQENFMENSPWHIVETVQRLSVRAAKRRCNPNRWMTNVEPLRYELTKGGYSCFAAKSSRQNLAALCAAASQNLAAVGSSHSLTETVDLGTMTTAGLIGTLHEIHLLIITYAQQSKDRSNA